jgi:phospholipid transport system transporter-binding protein
LSFVFMLPCPCEITHEQATACLSAWLLAAPASAQTVVVLDAGGLQHFDSSALAVLLALRRHLLAREQSLVLQQVPPRLLELATLYGVDELLGL